MGRGSDETCVCNSSCDRCRHPCHILYDLTKQSSPGCSTNGSIPRVLLCVTRLAPPPSAANSLNALPLCSLWRRPRDMQ